MVEEFTTNKDKEHLINIMKDYCSLDTTTPQDIFNLKKKLELDFSKAVNCTYCYPITPIDYGCDLREIFYDRNNKLIDGGQELLDIFKEKKLGDIWHIMTDIDDTLYPNTEHYTYIAGSDSSWEQKTAYPGIKIFYSTFYNKLDDYARYTTILSATPGCLKTSKITDSSQILHSILQNYGFIQGPESKLQVASFSGDIITNCSSKFCGQKNTTTNIETISNLFKLFGNTKFERFKQYLSIFPEYKILFFGDNGQGDVLAGIQMTRFTDNCHVFIHKVSEDGKKFKTVEEESQNIPRLNFFKNYYEAAQKLRELNIFNDDDVQNIKNEITQELEQPNKSKFRPLYNNILGAIGGRKTRKVIHKKRNLKKTKKNLKRRKSRMSKKK